MPDLPSHSDTGDAPPDITALASRRLRIAIIVIVAAALLAVMIVLHVTGVVGAGTNG